jgi:hypothetical protein
MNKLLLAIAAMLLMAGAANATSQRLNDKQMDRVTAGFSATSTANAEGHVGALETVVTTTATLSLVVAYATASQGEITWTLGSLSAAPTVASTTPLFSIPGLARQ